jgi:hypothetical protein
MPMKKPFSNPKDSRAFMRSFVKEVATLVKEEQKMFISETNVHSFNHGRHWQSHNSSNPDEVSTLQHVSNEITVEKSDIVQYNVEALTRTARDLAGAITSSFLTEMYATVGKACDANGQVVNGKGKSTGEQFIEILEKLEFGVDRNGLPVLPDIHVGPDGLAAFKKDPSLQDPEIKSRIDEVTERKKKEALERERARLAKYRRSDDQG